jgi:transglutaminase-like putative cysteine protease
MMSSPQLSSVTPVQPEHLAPTFYLDSEHDAVRAFAQKTVNELPTGASDIEKAVALYYRVRDEIRYDPYSVKPESRTYQASTVLADGAAFCIPKAILLAAAARAVEIPAAIGLADVKNHLTTPKLRALMNTDLFIHHGYTVLHLGGRWVKATPAFNIELCNKFGVLPLEFDGRNDSLMHPYDAKRQRHMEYVQDHGWFADFPFERVMADFRRVYPHLLKGAMPAGRFEHETPIQP